MSLELVLEQSLKATIIRRGNVICLPRQHVLSIVYSLLYCLGTCLQRRALFCLISFASIDLSLWPPLSSGIHVKSSKTVSAFNSVLTLSSDIERLDLFPSWSQGIAAHGSRDPQVPSSSSTLAVRRGQKFSPLRLRQAGGGTLRLR